MNRLQCLIRLARALDYNRDPDPKHWKTINGAKVHLDNNGNYDGGAGGKFNGNHHYGGPDWKQKKEAVNSLYRAFSSVAAQKQASANAQGNGKGNTSAQNVASKATNTMPTRDIIESKKQGWMDKIAGIKSKRGINRIADEIASEYSVAFNSVTSLQEWQNEKKKVSQDIHDIVDDALDLVIASQINLSHYEMEDKIMERLNKTLDVTKNTPPAIQKELKEKMRPPMIANVKRGNPMSEEQANKGNANPNYHLGPNSGYTKNCQTCVVAYELRRRGYDVSALPKINNPTMTNLSLDTSLAWIDPNTGKKPRYIESDKVTTPKQTYNWMKKEIDPNGRYTIEFDWKTRGGHIIHARKDKTGEIELYDPQAGKIEAKGQREIEAYFSRIRFCVNTPFGKVVHPPKMLRVDTLIPNENILNDVLT